MDKLIDKSSLVGSTTFLRTAAVANFSGFILKPICNSFMGIWKAAAVSLPLVHILMYSLQQHSRGPWKMGGKGPQEAG